jgi:ubiquinone/menaquinone biosynthesis C-methylase UbiE
MMGREMKLKSSFWDGIATSYNIVSEASVSHNKKFQKIVSVVMAQKPQSVLDAGCGGGIFARKLVDAGYMGEILCTDFSNGMLEVAKRNNYGGKKIDYMVADLNRKLPFSDGRFDAVTNINVLFWIKNKQGLLREFHRVISKNGVLILVNPKIKKSTSNFLKEQFSGKGLVDSFQEIFKIIFNLHHLYRMLNSENDIDKLHKKGKIEINKKEQIIDMLKSAGFSSVTVEDVQASQNWMFIARRG